MEVDVDLANYTTTPYSFDTNAAAQVGPCQGWDSLLVQAAQIHLAPMRCLATLGCFIHEGT